MTASVSPGVGRHDVGAIPVLSLIDGFAAEDGREILYKPGFEGDPWEAHADLLTEDGLLEMTMGAYLIVSGDRRVLVDAGLGNLVRGSFHGGAMIESLALAGFTPDDVTDVVLTHLHFDHVGWATSKGQIVFPNATYRCHEADWAHFVGSDEAEEGAVRKLSPLEPQLELFDNDHTVAPGIDVRHMPGHTPGSVVVVVSDGDDRAMLLGDIAHCPAELTEDDWEATFDVDPAMARRTREALARELEGSDVAIGAAHFPGLKFGRLMTGKGQRSWLVP